MWRTCLEGLSKSKNRNNYADAVFKDVICVRRDVPIPFLSALPNSKEVAAGLGAGDAAGARA